MPHREVPGFGREAEEGMKGKPSPKLYWHFCGKAKVGQSKQLSIGQYEYSWWTLAVEVVFSQLIPGLGLI